MSNKILYLLAHLKASGMSRSDLLAEAESYAIAPTGTDAGVSAESLVAAAESIHLNVFVCGDQLDSVAA